MELVREIIPFNMQHNAECEALQEKKISLITLRSFNCIASLIAEASLLNFLKMLIATVSKTVFSGSATYCTQLLK